MFACQENDDYKRYVTKAIAQVFTFDLADQCVDELVDSMNFKSPEQKTDLKAQAKLRGQEIQSDILLFSSQVAKARLNAAVHRRYDFCLTSVDEEGQGCEVLQQMYDSMCKYAPALQVARNKGDKAITNVAGRTSNIRDSFNMIVVVTEDCFVPLTAEGKPNPLLEEIKTALESDLWVSIIQVMSSCPDFNSEIMKCTDSVLVAILSRATRYVYIGDTYIDATLRAVLAEPAAVKTDDNKTPRTRAAGVASFKLNYKNSQAMELAFDGRLSIYKTMLYEMKNKKVPGDVETCIKGLFEMYDTEKKGRINWGQFAEIDRLMVETLGGQYSEMISRRVYSMMLYPGLTLESEISYTTFFNYHAYIAKAMGIFEGDARDVSIHYKYISDKVKHMRKGKRFQKKYDLFVVHDRSKFANKFAFDLKASIRDYTPNLRCALCTEFDVKVVEKDDDKAKKGAAPVKKKNALRTCRGF